RHWPRMPEEQLAAVLAKGPLGSRLASDKGTQVAQADAASGSRKFASFLAKLFNGGKDEEEDAETAAAPAPSKAAAKPAQPAAAQAPRTEKVVPLPPPKPVKPETYQVASAASKPVPAPAAATYEVASATSTPVLPRPAQAASLVARSPMSA